MDHFNFGDGGAFPEVHCLQYPSGLGKKELPKHQPVAGTTAATSTTTSSVPTSSNALILRAQDFKPEELERPKAEELAQNDLRTANKLALVIADKAAASAGGIKAGGPQQTTTIVDYTPQLGTTRTIKVTEVQHDPLAPSKYKAKKLQKGAVGDPAPIVRSPTKRRPTDDNVGGSGISGDSGNLGVGAFGGDPLGLGGKVAPSLSNFKNPRNLAIPIEQRVAAERDNRVGGLGASVAGGKSAAGITLGKPVNAASSLHLSLKQRMMQASLDQQKVSEDSRRDRAAEQETEQRKMDEEVENEALAAILRGNKEAAQQRRAETVEERAARIHAEREERDRRKEEERKIRMNEDKAKRLGISVEDVQAAQADIDDQNAIVDDRATSGGVGGKAGGEQDLYENPLFGTNKGKNKFTYRHGNIQQEMQKQQQEGANRGDNANVGGDDVFGVVSTLRGKRARD